MTKSIKPASCRTTVKTESVLCYTSIGRRGGSGVTVRRQSIASISTANCAGEGHGAIDNRWPDEAAGLQFLGQQPQAGAIPVDRLEIVPALAAENKQTAVERTGPDHLLDLRGQPVEPAAQINRTAGKEHLRPRRQADHAAPLIARSTRDKAFSLTNASTLTRLPSGKAISIAPARASARRGADGASGGASRAGAAVSASPTTASGTNSTAADEPAAAAAFQAARQLYSRLSEIRCRCATSFTLPPSASTSAISAAFSSILHFRRRSARARISTSDTQTSFWSDRSRLQQRQISAIHAPLATRPRPSAYSRPASPDGVGTAQPVIPPSALTTTCCDRNLVRPSGSGRRSRQTSDRFVVHEGRQ